MYTKMMFMIVCWIGEVDGRWIRGEQTDIGVYSSSPLLLLFILFLLFLLLLLLLFLLYNKSILNKFSGLAVDEVLKE